MLVGIVIELVFHLLGIYTHDNNYTGFNVPWNFAWIWILISLILLALIGNKLGVNVVSLYIWMWFCIIPIVVIKFTIPDNVDSFGCTYYGMDAHSSVRIIEGTHLDSDEALESDNFKSHLFSSSNSRFKTYHEENYQKISRLFKNRFIFWQTGLAHGYTPFQIVNLKEVSKWELYFTVGPLVILESLYFGILLNSTILIFVQLLLYIKFKEFVIPSIVKTSLANYE